MLRLFFGALACGLILCLWATPDARAEKKKVLVVETWKGSVDNEKLMQPAAIISAKGLDKVWKDWKVKGKTPNVDFKKFIVVGVYSPGSNLNIAGVTLDDDGNLDVLGFGTQDFGPGFRYVLGLVSNDGVKTVGGKKLPKE